jgi:hypothetical protein
LSGDDVFEDNSVLPWVVGGRQGMIVVRANATVGARLSWIGADARDPARLAVWAQGEPIGQGRRWMAPTTDGKRLMACHTPHIGGQLVAYEAQGSNLRGQRVANDCSSHRMGDPEVSCTAWGPSGVLWIPSQDRLKLHAFIQDPSVGWTRKSTTFLSHPARSLRALPPGMAWDALALMDNGAIVTLPAPA